MQRGALVVIALVDGHLHRGDAGQIHGRYRGDTGEIQARYRGDTGEIQMRYREICLGSPRRWCGRFH